MAEENQNINPEEESSKQEQENQDLNQEDLAKQWEESLQQQEKKQEGSSDENQEDLAKQWEEALQQQNEESNDNQEDLAKQWEETLQQQEEGKSSEKESIQGINIPGIDNEKLEMLLDIPLEISVEVGNKTLTLEDILKLSSNAIVELDRYINEPVDIKINGKLIAKGELYTVENNFGIKITNIVTVQERLKFLMENGGE